MNNNIKEFEETVQNISAEKDNEILQAAIKTVRKEIYKNFPASEPMMVEYILTVLKKVMKMQVEKLKNKATDKETVNLEIQNTINLLCEALEEMMGDNK